MSIGAMRPFAVSWGGGAEDKFKQEEFGKNLWSISSSLHPVIWTH